MNNGTFTQLRPISLLRHLSSSHDTTCVEVLNNSVKWKIYLEQGKITYATNSVEPFDRLERHLRRLSHQFPSITNEIRVQLRLTFENDLTVQNQASLHPEPNTFSLPVDYQAICWLINEQHLSPEETAVLIQEVVKEVVESLLLIKQGTYELKSSNNTLPKICRLDTEKTLIYCQERLDAWKYLAPQFSSPFQRPYVWMKTNTQRINLPGIEENLAIWMKGFSLRHLAVIMNQEELQLARTLYPYVINGTILLHEPDPPFDKLPKTFENFTQVPTHTKELASRESRNKVVTVNSTTTRKQLSNYTEEITTPSRPSRVSAPMREPVREPMREIVREKVQTISTSNSTTATKEKVANSSATSKKLYKILSVDDSPTILKEISRFLEDENFSVVTINEPLKAVMSIIREKPDLILLDLNMEGIDGYELCRLVKNNSMFKKTPIVMVTGNKGLVDKVRAKLVGASGYLTKPFDRTELLKMVFMHLAG
jgi:two-component system, chemotaxis family, response regulator PixG